MLRGPSPGAPPPPLMQVPTHLRVHDSAFAELGFWILRAFSEPVLIIIIIIIIKLLNEHHHHHQNIPSHMHLIEMVKFFGFLILHYCPWSTIQQTQRSSFNKFNITIKTIIIRTFSIQHRHHHQQQQNTHITYASNRKVKFFGFIV